ncbi:hypothetical protein F5B18DRAFT_668585 [Nemania serpens]|nr:hypothetical protein F5B18DRAFT_668585 [Nemania serpens]
MQGHRILITLLTAPIIASSASFLSISQPITGPASTSLSSHSSESNDSPVNTLDLDFEDPIHESGDEDSYGRRDYDVSDEDDVDKHDDGDEEDDDDDDDNDLEDDDAWEEEFDLNPNNATDRETSLNITFHPSAAARRVLPVKRIKCSRHRVGHNIPGAIKALTDWGHEHLVGRNNWHWAGVRTYQKYAIVWMCNCRKYEDRPINCWEISEALRLIAKKCGPERGGRVTLHGKKEIGVGSVQQVLNGHDINIHASLCHRVGCCNHFQSPIIQCGRRHPPNPEHQGDDCSMDE